MCLLQDFFNKICSCFYTDNNKVYYYANENSDDTYDNQYYLFIDD